MTIETLLVALATAAVVQLLNTWKLWVKMAVIETRLDRIEQILEDIGHFRVSRDISQGKIP